MKAPERWLDRPDSLSDELLAGMQDYASMGLSERELAQLRVGLRLKTSGAPSLALKVLKWLAALATVGGIAWLAWPAPPLPPPQRAPAAPPVEAPWVVAPSPELAPSEAAPPAAPVRRKRSARVAVPPPATPEPAALQDPAAELALLQRARRVLASAPTIALTLTDEHLRSFPQGTFAEERELIAIEALAPQDPTAAQERARRFTSKYPHSVHQARIETLLGAR